MISRIKSLPPKVLRLLMFFKNYAATRGHCYLLFSSPNHGNLGDHAIVMAEMEFLKSIDPSRKVLEVPSILTTAKMTGIISKIIKERAVFIHGGGFIGTIWPQEEQKARNTISAYRKRIIIFPQTLFFDESPQGEKEREITRQIYDGHPDLWICTRDQRSYLLAKEMFNNVHVIKMPDMVLYLKDMHFNTPRRGALLCMRSDKEKTLSSSAQQQIEQALAKYIPPDEIRYTDTVVDYDIGAAEREHEVQKKLSEFAAASIVITDRLHGMIFAAITGTPCVALNNSSKKVEGVYQWIKENEYISFIEDASQLESAVQQVLSIKNNRYRNDHLTGHYQVLGDLIKESF